MVAIFGIAQYYSVQGQLLYWPTAIDGGLGFGPFVNRNHFPFFLNLTLGLAVGLLIERLERFGAAWPRMIFSDVTFTWLIAAVGIMMSSLVVCGSRGGVLTAFFAISLVATLRFRLVEAGRFALLAVLIGVPVAALLIWIGFDMQESRLSMLAESDRYTGDGRWYLWKAALKSVPDFLWLGSGGETYRFWESIYPVGALSWIQDEHVALRADNEFLDVLNEFGLVGCLGVCLIATSVVVQCVRSSRQSGLAAGGAIGLLAVSMHSVVDFGLRIPATAVTAMTIMMLLNALPNRKRRRLLQLTESLSRGPMGSSVGLATERLNDHNQRGSRYPWMFVALLLIVVGLVSIRTRRRYFEAEKHRIAAARNVDNLAYDEAMLRMQRAVDITPEDAFLRVEAVRVAEFVRDNHQTVRQKSAATEMIVKHCEVLMQQCPLDWKPYTWIAQYETRLPTSTKMEMVLKARSLNPSHADLAYLAGKLELERNGLEAALPHWQDSLAMSLDHLPEISNVVRGRLSASDWTMHLLPDDPVVTFAAAKEVESGFREILLERTLALLDNSDELSRLPSPGQWEALRGEVLVELGRHDEGIVLMRRALNQQPENVSWRLKFAAWCVSEERLSEAVREIRIVLTLDPGNKQALLLQQEVSQRKARAAKPLKSK
ncbi:O-antigen ligase family protein [Rhodopirellula sallentina]|nr:O-antigen ligase family protein [Rhodopirellula sallentina]